MLTRWAIACPLRSVPDRACHSCYGPMPHEYLRHEGRRVSQREWHEYLRLYWKCRRRRRMPRDATARGRAYSGPHTAPKPLHMQNTAHCQRRRNRPHAALTTLSNHQSRTNDGTTSPSISHAGMSVTPMRGSAAALLPTSQLLTDNP